ncbi:MAG: BMP family protein [Beutenbergiaceae bacterium]
MRLRKSAVALAAAALTVTLAACGSGSDENGGDSGGEAGGEASGELMSVAHVLAGYLGDQSFYDDANRGMEQLAAEGNKIETLQADPNNPGQWRANLESSSTGDWDIVVIGSPAMTDMVLEVTEKFPEQKYLFYDHEVDHPNIASVVYKQNEGSFLAGVLAALVTSDTATFSLANDDKVVGLVGGQDIPVINDFVVGFEAGVAAVDPEIEVLVSYVGNFTDSQKGYDQTTAMYDQGADVVFQVAGGAGTGVLQAAADSERYAIGVDQNQNALQPGYILASMLKNVGPTIADAVHAAQDGTLEWGAATSYGLANDGVGLEFADNSDLVPQSVIDELEGYKQQVVDGEIEVPSAY